MEIQAFAEMHPTEDPEKVKGAMLCMFPCAKQVEPESEGRIVMVANDMDYFFRRISELKIRDAARAVLLRGIRGGVMTFCLNKQAAFCGMVNFTEEDLVLGNIHVTVTGSDPRQLVMRYLGDAE